MSEGHRLSVEFEEGMPRLTLIHPTSGCHEGTCSSCGGEGCDECPTPGECWMQGWVDYAGAECLEGGPVEFPVTAECDGEEFYLHVAPGPQGSQSDPVPAGFGAKRPNPKEGS
jgi:hypothetical protein